MSYIRGLEALKLWEDLPVVSAVVLVFNTEVNTVVVFFPNTDDVISGHVVYGPTHVIYTKNMREKTRQSAGLGVIRLFPCYQLDAGRRGHAFSLWIVTAVPPSDAMLLSVVLQSQLSCI